MITSFMTDQEIYNEAKSDFLEMKEKVRIAFGEFHKRQNQINGDRYFIHSVVQTKTYRTKKQNVWNIRFQDCGHLPNGKMITYYVIYLKIVHRDGRTDYFFMNNVDLFIPEKLTAHFIQRYKERYLIPHNIDLRGMPAAIYFLYNNQDRKTTYYIPKGWTEEDTKKKCFWISDQGLFVSEGYERLNTFITFLDQENLSTYKASIYEEEYLWRIYMKIDPSFKDAMKNQIYFNELFQYPNAKTIIERYIRRRAIEKGEALEKLIIQAGDYWDRMVKSCKRLDELCHKRDTTLRIKNKDVYMNKEITKLF